MKTNGPVAAEAEQIVRSLTSLDRDYWAKAWCKVGLAHEARGDERAGQAQSIS